METQRLEVRSPVRLILPVLAACVVAGSVFLSGVLRQGPGKDIDTRYFFVAAKLWASGHSPYEMANYVSAFAAQFGVPPNNGYPYLPTSAFFVLPMALFDWQVAARLFSVLNFLAAMALFGGCWFLLRRTLGVPLRPFHWLWLVLGSTVGGTAGTIFTGQTSVFIAAAGVAALVGIRTRQPWLTVIGMVIATAKPQLSFPLLPFLAAFQLREWKALAAAAVTATAVAVAAVLDGNLVRNFQASLTSYSAADVNNVAKGFGFAGFLHGLGIPSSWASLLGILLCLAVLGRAAWVVIRAGKSPAAHPGVLVLLTLAAGLALPLHSYDTCCYALAITLTAATRPQLQAAMILPTLLVWRPNFLPNLLARFLPTFREGAAALGAADGLLIAGWLFLLMAAFITAGGKQRAPGGGGTT